MDEKGAPITILITGLRRGGAETQAVRLAAALVRRGWNCRLLSLVKCNDFEKELADAGVEHRSFGMGSAVQAVAVLVRLRAELRERRPRVLLSFMFHANLMGRLAAWGLGIPAVIASVRSENFGGRWRDRLLRWTDSLGHRTTTNSRLVAERLIARGVVPAGRLTVVPNAVADPDGDSTASDRDATRREAGCNPDDFVWLTAGRLTEAKDYPGLLAAFAPLAGSDARVRLWIAGQGELEQPIRRRIADLGLEGRVSLLGLRRDLPRWLRAADAFVLSSSWEGLPNVLLEAMASGLPVVSTRVGGVPEILGEDSPWVCPPRDPEALHGLLARVSALDRPELSRMAAEGWRRTGSAFSETAIVQRWVDLFEEVIEGGTS